MGTIGKEIDIPESTTVHPHVRGDNIIAVFFADDRRGSPPRAWGQSTNTLVSITQLRFTPTCVGTIGNNTIQISHVSVHPHVRGDNPTGLGMPVNVTVHPHVRGDNVELPWMMKKPPGSPPRAWGQCIESLLHYDHHWFTPTCVGTMNTRRPCQQKPSVHPHVRGDNNELITEPQAMHGSPPRAWGQCGSCSPSDG